MKLLEKIERFLRTPSKYRSPQEDPKVAEGMANKIKEDARKHREAIEKGLKER